MESLDSGHTTVKTENSLPGLSQAHEHESDSTYALLTTTRQCLIRHAPPWQIRQSARAEEAAECGSAQCQWQVRCMFEQL
jgi:hypothetical protein